MTKNNLLNTASVICKFLQAFYILSFVFMTLLFFHVQVDREFYHDKPITIEKNLIHFHLSGIDSENTEVTLYEMSASFLYLTFFKLFLTMLLLFLSTREFGKIIRSVRNLATFQNANVKSFRRIAWCAFIYWSINSFTIYGYGGFITSSFSISFIPLVMMLIAFIMAEIFKEGSLLIEDKELTI